MPLTAYLLPYNISSQKCRDKSILPNEISWILQITLLRPWREALESIWQSPKNVNWAQFLKYCPVAVPFYDSCSKLARYHTESWNWHWTGIVERRHWRPRCGHGASFGCCKTNPAVSHRHLATSCCLHCPLGSLQIWCLAKFCRSVMFGASEKIKKTVWRKLK